MQNHLHATRKSFLLNIDASFFDCGTFRTPRQNRATAIAQLLPRIIKGVTIALLCTLIAAYGQTAQSPITYIVKKGDTIFSLAHQFDIDQDVLLSFNKLSDPNQLKNGQKITIPLVHRVAKNETLFRIAKNFGVSQEELLKVNGLESSTVIKVGQRIVIPLVSPISAVATTTPTTTASTSSTASTTAVKNPPVISTSKVTDTISAKPPDGRITTSSAVSAGTVSAPSLSAPAPASVAALGRPDLWPCKGRVSYLDGKAFGVSIDSAPGEVVRAVASGTVSSAGPYRGYGNVIIITSKQSYVYVYGGNESINVATGDKIAKGQELGRVGIDSIQGKSLAYFLVSRNGEPLDPALAPRD